MRIGVDLGGTKIEAIALADDGSIAERRRRPTPADNYSAILASIRDLVLGLEADLGANASVGIATPGSLSPKTGLIRNSNTLVMNGRPFAQDLGALLRREIRTENDANCLALSEAADGAAAGAANVFAVILGTGVGGGLVIDRKLVSGRNRIAGEWGHTPVPLNEIERRLPPRACFCGQQDCIETYLCGGAFSAEHRQRTGKELSATAIAEAAAAGEGPRRRRSIFMWIGWRGRWPWSSISSIRTPSSSAAASRKFRSFTTCCRRSWRIMRSPMS